jgi:hypothetical protein
MRKIALAAAAVAAVALGAGCENYAGTWARPRKSGR